MPKPLATPCPPAADAPSAVTFQLAGHGCRVVCVDGLMPHHHSAQGHARARMTYLSNEVVHFELGPHRYALVAEMPSCVADAPDLQDGLRALLTNRELQIVQFICMGLLTKQVADRLHISEFTVRSYLKTIYCKLGVRSRGAMVYAYAQSLARARAAMIGPDCRAIGTVP